MTLEEAIKLHQSNYQGFIESMWDGKEENPYDEAFRMAIKALEILEKLRDLTEGTIGHFDRDDAMDVLYEVKRLIR